MHSKKTLFALTIAVALVGFLGFAAASQGVPQYKLGGAFIGNNGAGNTWNALQIPLDPAGRTAALRVNLTNYNARFAGLLAGFGADTVSEFVGEEMMVGRDTAQYRTLAYATAHGNPPQRRAILVMTGTLQFDGPNNFTVSYTLEVYAASADADMDGFPDAGVLPVLSLPAEDHASRGSLN